jgi:hypothetical protein
MGYINAMKQLILLCTVIGFIVALGGCEKTKYRHPLHQNDQTTTM